MSDLNLPVSIIVNIIVPYSTYNSTYDAHVHDLKTFRHEQNFIHLKKMESTVCQSKPIFLLREKIHKKSHAGMCLRNFY